MIVLYFSEVPWFVSDVQDLTDSS